MTAVVVVDGGHTVRKLSVVEHCRRQPAGYKKPTRVLVAASLPRTASQKSRVRQYETSFGRLD